MWSILIWIPLTQAVRCSSQWLGYRTPLDPQIGLLWPKHMKASEHTHMSSIHIRPGGQSSSNLQYSVDEVQNIIFRSNILRQPSSFLDELQSNILNNNGELMMHEWHQITHETGVVSTYNGINTSVFQHLVKVCPFSYFKCSRWSNGCYARKLAENINLNINTQKCE